MTTDQAGVQRLHLIDFDASISFPLHGILCSVLDVKDTEATELEAC